MPDYRLYVLNADGRIMRVHETNCVDDSTALVEAEALGHSHSVEVWDRARRVGEVAAAHAR